MNLAEIKQAVDNGIQVNYKSANYVVVKSGSEYFIMCLNGDKHTIGLEWMDGMGMNGKEEDFFMMRSSEDMIKMLIKQDIEDIMENAKNDDYRFITDILMGKFIPYGKKNAADLHEDYMDLETRRREMN